MGQELKTSGMAIALLVVGITSIASIIPPFTFFSWILAVLGIVFGGVGDYVCKKGEKKGRGMAIACTIVK